jgi:hypothetical protein
MGPQSPSDVLFQGLFAAAFGVRGMSFYCFVERDDWMGSPVNSVGKRRPALYDAHADLVSVIRRLHSSDRRIADLGLVWSMGEYQRWLAQHEPDPLRWCMSWLDGSLERGSGSWWKVFNLLLANDVDFILIDERDLASWNGPTLRVVTGGDYGPDTLVLDRPSSDTTFGNLEYLDAGRLRMWIDGNLATAQSVSANTEGVLTTVFQSESCVTLFVINTNSHPVTPQLSLRADLPSLRGFGLLYGAAAQTVQWPTTGLHVAPKSVVVLQRSLLPHEG